MVSIRQITLLVLLGALGPAAHAGEADKPEAPPAYQFSGPIDDMNLGNRTIVVNDSMYQLAPVTVVHDGKRLGAVQLLRKKQRIGFNVRGDGREREIGEIWLLKGKED